MKYIYVKELAIFGIKVGAVLVIWNYINNNETSQIVSNREDDLVYGSSLSAVNIQASLSFENQTSGRQNGSVKQDDPPSYDEACRVDVIQDEEEPPPAYCPPG